MCDIVADIYLTLLYGEKQRIRQRVSHIFYNCQRYNGYHWLDYEWFVKKYYNEILYKNDV